MKASIIITSFNRPELLSFGLESLARQGFSKDDVEVIVLNDGDANDSTEGVCEIFEDDLNIRYFSAQNRTEWRVPGFAVNFGVKQSLGQYIFISCAEIYHIDNTVEKMINMLDCNAKILCIPSSGKDDDGSYLSKLKAMKSLNDDDYTSLPNLSNIHFPFFMGMHKKEFIKIGGYDEDFVGIGFDDNDIVHRLQRSNNSHARADCRIIHLYHERLSFSTEAMRQMLKSNERLFHSRKSSSNVRNVGRDWGNSF